MFINAASAQNTKRKDAPSLNFGIEAALPTGDLSLITSFGGGGSLKLIVPLDNTVSFIISAGFIHYFSKTLFGEKFGGFNSFPFKGGFRFSAKPGFYFEPQAGYSIFISRVKVTALLLTEQTLDICCIKKLIFLLYMKVQQKMAEVFLTLDYVSLTILVLQKNLQ